MDENQISSLLKQQMTIAKASKRLNQSQPVPRPYKDSAEELMRWRYILSQYNDVNNTNAENGMISTKTTILSGDIHSCFTPFEDLNPIRLRDMKVPMVHKGRYLVCKVAAQPSPMVAVNILVHDLNGDIDEAALYNFRYKIDNLDWISPGTILVIKEPWLRYSSQGKRASIRIDSPTDVIFVDPADEEFMKKIGATKWYESMSKDAEVWRQKANESFKKGDYEKALFLYDRAIRCNPELAVLYLNKSMACLKLGAFYKAYEAAKIGLEKGGDREKALYRLGQAAYGMRDWQKSALHYVEVLKEFPGHTFASAELKRTTARLNEQRSGKYDFKTMYIESKKIKPNLDVADYKGPIEIVKMPGKGRGIIASEDIKEGTLLLVSKAFSSGYSVDYPGILFAINLIRGRADTASQMLQIVKAMEVLQNNPTRGKEIYDLYAGDMEPVDGEIPFGVIDAARIQLIGAYNVFSSDLPEKNFEVDTFGKNDKSHLFTLPSYFNHACLDNANRDFYGDVMVIHASADIKKGEEITLTYCSPLVSLSERKKVLNKWNFTCHCKLCEIDANDIYETKRGRMFEEFIEFVKAHIETKAEKSQAYYANGNTEKCIQYLEEVVTLMDNQLKHAIRLENARVNIATHYLSEGNFSKFDENIKAVMALKYCTDMDHFKLLYPALAQHLP